MATSYAELIKVVSKDDQLRTLLQLMTLAGFPATSWQPGSVPRTLVEIEAEALATIANLVRDIARGGLLDEAEGDWLTLKADSDYDVQRHPPVSTRGYVALACLPTAGPYTIAAGQLTAADAAGHMFRSIAGGTLASGGTLVLEFQASSPGSAHNVPAGAIDRLMTPLAGVTASNALAGPLAGLSDWKTVTGTDEESDERLRARCRSRWSTLGPGAVPDTYIHWATTASPEITRVKVIPYSNIGVPTPGHVTLYLAGQNGSVSEAARAAAQTYIQARQPLHVTTHILRATAVPVLIESTLTIKAGYRAEAESGLVDLINRHAETIGIGGATPNAESTVFRSGIVEVLMAPGGMLDAVLALPAADVALGLGEVATFFFNAHAQNWIEV